MTELQVQKLESCDCKAEKCREMCDIFSNCRNRYTKKWKIILQPYGVKNKKGTPYKIQFNLLDGTYIVNRNESYATEDEAFIQAHIDFFGLNDVDRRNKELAIYCKNVIAEKSILTGVTVNHLIVDLFRERLETLPVEKAIKVCEVVYAVLLQARYT